MKKNKNNTVIISIILVSLGLLVFSAFSPYLFTRPGAIDFTNTGGIGDTINGLMSPFIAILAAFLTFCAFYIQFDANRIQNTQIIKDKIESRIFNLINIHRSNINDLVIKVSTDNILTGHECINFLCMTINKIESLLQKDWMPFQFNDKNRKIFAYLFLCHNRLLRKSSFSSDKYSSIYNEEVLLKLVECYESNDIKIPNTGYANLLSRYFRQIFQIIKFIDSQEVLTQLEKYDYAKILRSSLTSEEQILLFSNLLSPYGKAWIDNDYVCVYKIIKNIPLHLMYGYKPTEWFIDEFGISREILMEYFEYYEY